jgi:hypothetical protein
MKFEHKHLKTDESRCAIKSQKKPQKDTKITQAKRMKLMQPRMLPYNQSSDSVQNHEENLA